jgi:hypothetical protein
MAAQKFLTMANASIKKPTGNPSRSFIGAGKHLGLAKSVSSDPIPKSEWKKLEERFGLSEEFTERIKKSEKEMAQGNRPRVRQRR